ncbi:MAG: cellulase family glycosylhydrolase, partial [Candidatus Hydrogenedentota bacterium]
MKMHGLSCFLVCISALSGAAEHPLEMDKPLRIAGVEADKTDARVFERVTLDIDLEASYTNPFRSEEVRVDVEVVPEEEGQPHYGVPAFLYQPFERQLKETEKGSREVLAVAGESQWQARLSFPKAGRYSLRVGAKDASGTVYSEPIAVTISSADVPGMARTHPADHRYFVTDRGETLYLRGANVCWGGARGTYNYDDWLPKYAEAHCNFFRVWLSPSWTTFAMNTNESGYDGIALGNAWRLDYVLERAERLGLRIMVCIDSFNILRSKESLYGAWEDSPYIEANGGPLSESSEYFTNETMLTAYRDRLRYLVARYGYSSSVFAWEFWNEVDIVDDYQSDIVAAWHANMAGFLRELDPWDHLITTSFAGPRGDPNVDCLPELDFVQTHHYQAKDMARDLGLDRAGKRAVQIKPHFHGEYGIDHGGRAGEMDPDGIHIHNGAFSSVGQLQAGIPMTWWWDSYVHPRKLYPIFGAFYRWTEGFDFVQQGVRPLEAEFEGLDAADWRTHEDNLLHTEGVSWEPAPWNKPTTVRITREGDVKSDVPLSRLLHGVRNHPDLHNPVTFEVDVPEETTFGVRVEGVSGHGGARLEIRVEGEIVRTEDFADTDNETTTLNQYNRTYRVKLPKGKHTVIVENPGNDWFYVSYEVPWLRAEPILRALGVVGETQALVWIQNRAHTWVNMTKGDFDATPVSGALVT